MWPQEPNDSQRRTYFNGKSDCDDDSVAESLTAYPAIIPTWLVIGKSFRAGAQSHPVCNELDQYATGVGLQQRTAIYWHDARHGACRLHVKVRVPVLPRPTSRGRLDYACFERCMTRPRHAEDDARKRAMIAE